MCLRPLQLNNPTKKIDRSGGQLLHMQVRCNKCADCVEAIRSEWRFRAYHHAKDTIKKGGYVYFDTLTYAPEHVPHLSDFVDVSKYGITDFMCFDYRHFRLFIKRLRRHLEYHYGSSDFTYFMSTEYGTSETGTHRPHLHINFYVKSGLHPFTFSKAVHDCWQYGRCDGICEHEAKYVAEHIYGYDVGFGSNHTDDILLKLCNYVSKYITKDSTFQKEIDKRIKVIERVGMDKEDLDKLKRAISMYHRQSQGFGLSYIYGMSDREIHQLLDENKVLLPSSTEVVVTAPIPMYYKRKLFYKLCKRDDGTYFWQLTDYGIQYQTKNMLKRVDDICDSYTELEINSTPEEKLHLRKLLGDRCIEDYAIYKVFYQGRMRSDYQVNFFNGHIHTSSDLSDEDFNLHDWIKKIEHSCIVNHLDDWQVYTIDDYDCIQLSLNNLTDRHHLYEKLSISEDSSPSFANFDKLDSFILSLKKHKNDNKQKLFDYKEHLTKIFKHL